ncbi:neuroepithelial cell-transforming gene 1 protein isoform X3 [Hippopotamus amphibius kiboko]|uniref:neuroepithelial cell-transforming gene 1 protein isoform X3 n=1 Tax=Hippopotamus amphibius kiboko TaxID=575201 RepID=UPI0025972D1A|nr:neuroepithelial cell-transforming gene 1 protein isoform X3 [Hippopotamus amphibius kiboko]
MEPERAAQEQSRPRRRSRRASGLSAGGAAEPAGGAAEPSADTPGLGPDGRYSLQRGSSFTFLTPGPHWDFTLKRKRGVRDDDAVSLSSLDLKEPSNKRVRPLARVTSLANLISPVRNGAVRRFGQTIQSFTLRGDSRSPASAQKLSSRSTVPAPTKRRSSALWSETLDISMKQSLTSREIRRQEAIYEMFRGEQDLIEDLKLARKAYHDPMLKLSIMSEEELTHIFGDLDAYIPLHEDLLARIGEATKPGGTVEHIGHILVSWILIMQGVLSDINLKKGESECQYYIDKLEYLDEKQKDPRIEASKVLLCHGELKNKNGHKLYIFLFQDILVLTRPVTRNERHSYQVYRQPIPVQELVLEDLQDGDVRMGGSFRGAFSNSDKARNIFRVRFQDPSPGQSHTLQANDVFHKQQWFNCIRTAIAPFRQATSPSELQGLPGLHEECGENRPPTGHTRAQRRASTASSVARVEVDGDAPACGAPAHPAADVQRVKVPRAQAGLREARDKAQAGGERRETLV